MKFIKLIKSYENKEFDVRRISITELNENDSNYNHYCEHLQNGGQLYAIMNSSGEWWKNEDGEIECSFDQQELQELADELNEEN